MFATALIWFYTLFVGAVFCYMLLVLGLLSLIINGEEFGNISTMILALTVRTYA